MMPATYVRTAAEGMLASLAHYGNTSPPVGDGRMGTPAWFANRLGKVYHGRRLAGVVEDLPGDSTDWWGTRYAAYARLLLAEEEVTA